MHKERIILLIDTYSMYLSEFCTILQNSDFECLAKPYCFEIEFTICWPHGGVT